MSVNPYQSPVEPVHVDEDSRHRRHGYSVKELARMSSIAGAFAGATYGAATGVAIAIVLIAFVGITSPGTFALLLEQSVAFGIAMAIIGTLAGICNGAVIGMFDGILLARWGVESKSWLLPANIFGFGWVCGYQAHFESRIAIEYLSSLIGIHTLQTGSVCILTGMLVGSIGGVLTARSLVHTLIKILRFRTVNDVS